MRILEEPKNALTKQYQKLFEIDEVELIFEEDAIEAIVEKAIERKTGARGLRSIIEEIMRDIMFEIIINENKVRHARRKTDRKKKREVPKKTA